jgi:hypothetical protein
MCRCWRERMGSLLARLRAARPRQVQSERLCRDEGAFAESFATAMRPRLGLACSLDFATQTDFSEPLMRVNVDSADHYVGTWDEAAEGYRNGCPRSLNRLLGEL